MWQTGSWTPSCGPPSWASDSVWFPCQPQTGYGASWLVAKSCTTLTPWLKPYRLFVVSLEAHIYIYIYVYVSFQGFSSVARNGFRNQPQYVDAFRRSNLSHTTGERLRYFPLRMTIGNGGFDEGESDVAPRIRGLRRIDPTKNWVPHTPKWRLFCCFLLNTMQKGVSSTEDTPICRFGVLPRREVSFGYMRETPYTAGAALKSSETSGDISLPTCWLCFRQRCKTWTP